MNALCTWLPPQDPKSPRKSTLATGPRCYACPLTHIDVANLPGKASERELVIPPKGYMITHDHGTAVCVNNLGISCRAQLYGDSTLGGRIDWVQCA